MPEPAMHKDAVARLTQMIGAARRLVPFTGAGISTESGVPDFRSPGGLWTQYRPISFQDFLADSQARRETWRRRFALQDAFGSAKPNIGHKAVAAWIAQGRAPAVITQNVDNLHQDAGVPAEKVIEVHGNTTYGACLSCGRRHEIAWIRPIFEASGDPPACEACGGLLKTATISFGQPMPEAAMRRASALAAECDLFLVLGSSLSVYPAAELPLLARRSGAHLAIVNREPTPADCRAHLVVRGEIGAILDAFVHA